MNTYRHTKKNTCGVILGLILGYATIAATNVDLVQKATEQAARDTKIAERYRKKVFSLEKALEKNQKRGAKAREALEDLTSQGLQETSQIHRAEMDKNRADSKVEKLRKKLEKIKKKVTSTKEKAELSQWEAKKLISKKRYETLEKKAETIDTLLREYEIMIPKLKLEQRSSRAEALARTKINGREYSRWKRIIGNWNVQLDEARANSAFHKLKEYQEKIPEIKKRLEKTKKALEKAAIDYAKYNILQVE